MTADERAELEKVAGRPLRRSPRDRRRCRRGRPGGGVRRRRRAGTASACAGGARAARRQPRLRGRILDIRRAHDIVYDEVNVDSVLGVEKRAFDDDNPKHVVESWREWLEDHRDEVDALRVAFSRDPQPPAPTASSSTSLARSRDRRTAGPRNACGRPTRSSAMPTGAAGTV